MLAAGNEDGGAFALLQIVATIVALVLLLTWRRRLTRRGYRGAFDYLRSLPQTDSQKRDALDLLMRGIVMCPIGIIVWPLLVVGVFSVYYGVRKLCMVWMGLEILDEPDSVPSESNVERAPSDATT